MDDATASDPGGIAYPGTFRIYDDDLTSRDPLQWPGYGTALEEERVAAGVSESLVAGNAVIGNHRVELAQFHFGFMGGSMGEVAGERLARAFERAARRRVPLVLRMATGGARMQEGMRSLVQMPKVVVARRALAAAGMPFLAVLGNPTTGGVLASVGALADITFAESGATVGFAGPRVVQAQTGKLLREGSHTAEAALHAGLVDAVVDPVDVTTALRRALDTLDSDDPGVAPEPPEPDASYDPGGWIAVDLARADTRPRAPDLLEELGTAQVELRGDRAGGDDPAVVAALTRIEGRRALVLALDRRLRPGPRAYRKAHRALDIAVRLRLPVLTLIDTPGADAAEDSEGSGVAWAIAALFDRILSVNVPVVSIVTGEGGSGGALAFAAGDVLLAFEHSVFSVIAPELAAEILWRDGSRAREAADLLKPAAPDLLRMGIIDGMLPEPVYARSIATAFAYHLERLDGYASEQLISERHQRWRKFG